MTRASVEAYSTAVELIAAQFHEVEVDVAELVAGVDAVELVSVLAMLCAGWLRSEPAGAFMLRGLGEEVAGRIERARREAGGS